MIPKGKPAGTLSSQEAARVSGVGYRVLMRWVETGLLNPPQYSGAKHKSGRAFYWDLSLVTAARTILELRKAGLSLQKVRRAVSVVRKAGGELVGTRLWTDGQGAFEVCDQGRLVSLLDHPGQAHIFPLGAWAETVRKDFEAATAAEKTA